MTARQPSLAVCGVRRLIGRSRFVCIHRGEHPAGKHVFVRDQARRLTVVR